MHKDMPVGRDQFAKFKYAARALECDDDPERFGARMAKLVKQKPAEKPE